MRKEHILYCGLFSIPKDSFLDRSLVSKLPCFIILLRSVENLEKFVGKDLKVPMGFNFYEIFDCFKCFLVPKFNKKNYFNFVLISSRIVCKMTTLFSIEQFSMRSICFMRVSVSKMYILVISTSIP